MEKLVRTTQEWVDMGFLDGINENEHDMLANLYNRAMVRKLITIYNKGLSDILILPVLRRTYAGLSAKVDNDFDKLRVLIDEIDIKLLIRRLDSLDTVFNIMSLSFPTIDNEAELCRILAEDTVNNYYDNFQKFYKAEQVSIINTPSFNEWYKSQKQNKQNETTSITESSL